MRITVFVILSFLFATKLCAQDVMPEDSVPSAISKLEIPNVITPGAASGMNTVFMVKHEELQDFEIWIFNRWGDQLYHSNNPDEGWDGTDKGHVVPTGAYYYVVKATGKDGVKYNRKGNINVLRKR